MSNVTDMLSLTLSLRRAGGWGVGAHRYRHAGASGVGAARSIVISTLPMASRLLHVMPEQRQRVEISLKGLHWDELDEDICVAGLLAGVGDVSRPTSVTA